MKRDMIQDESVPQIDDEELRWRVIYSLFRPVVRLSGVFGLSLRDLKEWLGISYLHELKRAGLTQSESAERIGVSRRTIISLTRKLRDNFFEPERHEGVQRRVLFLLWAGPITRGRLLQALASEANDAEVDEALEELVASGAVRRDDTEGAPTYALEREAFRLYKDDWIARVDALNNQLDHISDTVFARFFDEGAPSFARTVTLTVRREDLGELERLYRDIIFPKLVSLDAAASEDSTADIEHLELSLSWAPKDHISRRAPLAGQPSTGDQDHE